MVRGTADLARLLDACRALAGMEKIILGMGEHGFCTRVLASRLGSSICFASAPGAIAAPGQADPRTLAELYRFSSVGPSTSVYGVVGSPVSHSLSPLIHNAGFAALGLDAVYLPFPVDDIEAFRPAADSMGVRGFSVTHPHKQAVIPLLAQRDGLVQATGACNTVIVTPGAAGSGPEWSGTNTDVEGFLAPLRRCLGGTIPRGLRATVVGAGGASRAVVHALASCGAEVLVLNRTEERARELARQFPVEAGPLDGEGASRAALHSDLIVQASSAGMAPGGRSDGDPFPEYRFRGHEVVYELVYAPPVTRFLERATQAGCRILQGRAMLLAQAREQFRLFTGRDLPEAVAQIEN
jgi:3-dehydroquinate dehydratase/shikimate dehydrogenase